MFPFGNEAQWRLRCLYDIWFIYTYIQLEPTMDRLTALTPQEGISSASGHSLKFQKALDSSRHASVSQLPSLLSASS